MRARLFGRILSLQARQQMSYRADFWINAVIGFVVQMVVVYFLWKAIFAESGSDRIGGFTFVGMIFYYATVMLLGKLIRGTERLGYVADEIYQGTLTRYLVYPTSFFPFKYAQSIGEMPPAIMQLVLFGVTFLVVFPIPAEVNVSIATVMMCVVCMVFAHFLHFLLIVAVEMVAFWADNVWSLNAMVRMSLNILGGMLLPLSIFPGWAQSLLAMLPFRYIYYQPVMVLLGEISVGDWLAGLGITAAWIVAFLAICSVVWKRGNLEYTGVGI